MRGWRCSRGCTRQRSNAASRAGADHAGRARRWCGRCAAHGATAILVSGGFTRFADPVGGEIGFDRAIANVLNIADGALTGPSRSRSSIPRRSWRRCSTARAAMGIAVEATLAVGDGANDLAMIARGGAGRGLSRQADRRRGGGARIDHNDLTALLWAQGVARKDWVRA